MMIECQLNVHPSENGVVRGRYGGGPPLQVVTVDDTGTVIRIRACIKKAK